MYVFYCVVSRREYCVYKYQQKFSDGCAIFNNAARQHNLSNYYLCVCSVATDL